MTTPRDQNYLNASLSCVTKRNDISRWNLELRVQQGSIDVYRNKSDRSFHCFDFIGLAKNDKIGSLKAKHQPQCGDELVLTLCEVDAEVRIARVEVADVSPNAEEGRDLQVKTSAHFESC